MSTTQTQPQKETLNFQTEVKQLLQLMIHSLYSNREIFLRELISNASDACDKLRFEAVTNGTLFENDSELKIRISVDNATGTITITDNGIGMSREEVIANIGTIAKSGTKEFFSKLTGDQKKDAHLIGQSSRNSLASPFKCRVTSVPRETLSTASSVNSPSPVDSQRTASSAGTPARRVTSVTRSATMNAE